MNARIPTRIDRYPAKMVSRLATRLVNKYASSGTNLLDPFAGSGAVIVAAKESGMSVSGVDLNPIASLFARVKLKGFNADRAADLLFRITRTADRGKHILPIDWNAKSYWFSAGTLRKLEAIRGTIRHLHIESSNERAAVLLSLALAVRACSRADQRSPKPFISKTAITERSGHHYCPFKIVSRILEELIDYYGACLPEFGSDRFIVADVGAKNALSKRLPLHSHIITSPPYINAQDYFRNFKLELFVLEGLLPYRVASFKNRFIGSERGVSCDNIDREEIAWLHKRLGVLDAIDQKSPQNGKIVRRYFSDMRNAITNMWSCLKPGGVLVIVCGDNLVAGERIRTSHLIFEIVNQIGFRFFDSFVDPIKDRLLAPKRLGHIGLIKEEMILAFKKPGRKK
ncbi:MAG: site-specific DNA-methyltransferase [Acidobacteriota bacterium]|nr:site-specific DNA-methyltransferase [Acidobacteriota bacterium]